jgi:hypothetical protein
LKGLSKSREGKVDTTVSDRFLNCWMVDGKILV